MMKFIFVVIFNIRGVVFGIVIIGNGVINLVKDIIRVVNIVYNIL